MPTSRTATCNDQDSALPIDHGIPGGMTEIDLGGRLKAIREAHGLSQRELSKRVGVTNGTISLIEQNRVSPTIASLRKVLSAFPISLSDFFAADGPKAPRAFFAGNDLTEIRGDDLTLRVVGPTEAGHPLQMMHEHYGASGDTGKELLSHEGHETGIVVRGTFEVTVGGQKKTLRTGDAYAFHSRIPHRFKNVGNSPGEIVSACTPPTF